MRVASALALTILATAPALAADYPVLRGGYTPTPSHREPSDDQTQWEGFYLGGHGGYSSGKFGPLPAVNDLIANILRQTAVESEHSPSKWISLGGGTSRSATFGGFLGYNMVFGDAVLGVEADYTKISAKYAGSDFIGRSMTTSTGYIESVGLSASGTMNLDHYGTIRARAGWAAGNFMPYLTGGLAIGKGSYNTVVSIGHSGVDADPTSPPDLPSFSNTTTATAKKKTVFSIGLAAGAGVEALIANNILLRAEYQFVRLAGTSGVPITLHNVRAGAGLKF